MNICTSMYNKKLFDVAINRKLSACNEKFISNVNTYSPFRTWLMG